MKRPFNFEIPYFHGLIFKTKYFPFGTYIGINLFGFIFVKSHEQKLINHESIHTAQQREMLYIGFYLWYLIEWFYRMIFKGDDPQEAYRNLSFEREAYENEKDINYLIERVHFAWMNYL